MNKTLKTGSCSIVIGNFYYKDFFKEDDNKLLKISKILKKHNEYKNIKEVKSIENYTEYYSLKKLVSY